MTVIGILFEKRIVDDSGFLRTPNRPVELLGTRVCYQRSVETTIGAHGPDSLGGSATHRVIVSLILVPCRARGSVIAVRRILVISPESSLHARRAVLVFARAKMCGHLSLICSIKCPSGKPQASFP